MRNRPFSFVFLGVVAAALLVQFGREIFPILSLPPHDREGPFWLFRESVLGQALPYGVLCLCVPMPIIRLPVASRWLLLFGLAVVAYVGVFDIGGLHMGGGENGMVALFCLNAQIIFATGVVVLALVAMGVPCTTYHRKNAMG